MLNLLLQMTHSLQLAPDHFLDLKPFNSKGEIIGYAIRIRERHTKSMVQPLGGFRCRVTKGHCFIHHGVVKNWPDVALFIQALGFMQEQNH